MGYIYHDDGVLAQERRPAGRDVIAQIQAVVVVVVVV